MLSSTNSSILVNYFHKYYQLDIISKLKTSLKAFDQRILDKTIFSSNGDIFISLELQFTIRNFFSILSNLENIVKSSIQTSYNLKNITLSLLKYFILKQPINKTFYISIPDLLEKNPTSL